MAICKAWLIHPLHPKGVNYQRATGTTENTRIHSFPAQAGNCWTGPPETQ
jgi:hypothetical protein